MMTPEQFKKIEDAVREGIQITAEQAKLLVDTVSRLDGTVAVFQNSLQLMYDGVSQTVPDLANKVLQRCGRTDKKTIRYVANMAADAVVTIENTIQQYLVQCMLQLAETLGVSLDELINGEDTTSQTSSSEQQA